MKFTAHMIAHMREQINLKAIEPDELRRVKGLGNLFMSTQRFPEDEEGEFTRLGWTYWFQYSLRIDGELYYFYGGTPDVLPDEQTMTEPE